MAAPPSHMWYVKAAGGVWGPYPEARIAGFVDEGRVSAQTPVSPWASGPFAPASESAEFAELFNPVAAIQASGAAGGLAVAPELSAAPAPTVEPAPAAATVRPAPLPAGPTTPLLVWAELSAESAPAFSAALGAAGAGLTIRPGMWLVRTHEGAAALRNRLSRRLGPHDTLMVVQAPLEQAAWFNLEPARDRELRRIWIAG